MISFTVLDDNLDEVKNQHIDSPFFPELSEIIDELSSLLGEGVEVAVCVLSDSMLVRIYDEGEYLFLSPVGLVSDWDFDGAIVMLAEYCVKELLPLRLTDVPREELMKITELFSHVDATAYSDDDDLFFVKVNNECDMLDSFPCLSYGRVTLSEITEEYKTDYASLCADAELNKYWGYDVRCDNPSGDPEFYFAVVKREFNDGAAITLGIYLASELIGEAVVYSFDFRGGAHIGVRLLPEYHGQGLGKESMEVLIRLCRDIGLSRLYAEVFLENEHSLRMTSRLMSETSRDKERAYFEKVL